MGYEPIHVLYPTAQRPPAIEESVARDGWNGRRTTDGLWEETNCVLSAEEIAGLPTQATVLTPDQMRAVIASARIVAPSIWEQEK